MHEMTAGDRGGSGVGGACGKQNAPGFTLIEVAVAVVLFSIVLLAAGGMLNAVSPRSTNAQAEPASTLHMQRQVERIYEADFAALSSGQADTTLITGAVIQASWTVTELVPGKLKQADLTVTTLANLPHERERAVRLFVANRNH